MKVVRSLSTCMFLLLTVTIACAIIPDRELASQFPDALYFLCGSPSYMEAVSAHLHECGVPEERVRIELFTVAGATYFVPLVGE